MAALAVGITGGIGTGKSKVSKLFKVLGIPVWDADSAAKTIMQHNLSVKEKLIATFGEATFQPDGTLNRTYLSKQVFDNAFKLEQLNQIVHPATMAAAADWMRKQHTPYAIKEAALMFEAGSTQGLDFIIGVDAPLGVRMQRVMHRDKVAKNDFFARTTHQIDNTLKMKLCDAVIINNNVKALLPQVLALHQQLLQLAAAKENITH
ncbi:MAG TPA: dephospho-CoA kinase [Chitinophagaceae bacterium]|nr:dephospho-CoA kinase [Chitinophagaceae bacterium]HAN39953.1 dephospho-CoA kinase [Chitinophagaceae bacterium]